MFQAYTPIERCAPRLVIILRQTQEVGKRLTTCSNDALEL